MTSQEYEHMAGETVMGIVAEIAPVREAVQSHRRALLDSGFSEPAAEVMAMHLHSAILTLVSKSMARAIKAHYDKEQNDEN